MQSNAETFNDCDHIFSHLNSLQKDSLGNYLIVGYHIYAILYVNGTDGSIIWQIGGRRATIPVVARTTSGTTVPYNLQHMHHARKHPISAVNLPPELELRKDKLSRDQFVVLSVFDNAFDCTAETTPTSPSSGALVLLLDLEAGVATILERYTPPFDLLAAAFGGFQLLPNGRRVVGWGSGRWLSVHNQSSYSIDMNRNNAKEYDDKSVEMEDSSLLYLAEVGDVGDNMGTYRVFKHPWVGHPDLKELVLESFSWTCDWQTVFWVSWNGATEVESWVFYGRKEGRSGGPPEVLDVETTEGRHYGGRPWHSRYWYFREVARSLKSGFETRVLTDNFVGAVFVEAIAKDGSVIGQSDVVWTKVPSDDIKRSCGTFGCPRIQEWDTSSDPCPSHSKSASVFNHDGQTILSDGSRWEL